jgi:hypothetical protein
LALPFSAVVQALGSAYVERHPVVDSAMTTMPTAGGRAGWSTRVTRAWRDRRSGPAP